LCAQAAAAADDDDDEGDGGGGGDTGGDGSNPGYDMSRETVRSEDPHVETEHTATEGGRGSVGKRKERESADASSEGSSAQVGDEGTEGGLQQGVESSSEPPAKRRQKEKQGKAKTMMSAELYRSMTAMIALILKTKVSAGPGLQGRMKGDVGLEMID
jgi:hypothetical protein